MGRITKLVRVMDTGEISTTEEQAIECITALKRPTAIMLVGANTMTITDVGQRLFNLLSNCTATGLTDCDVVLSGKIEIPNGVSNKNLYLILEMDQETSVDHEARHKAIEELYKIGTNSTVMIYVEYDGENSCYSDPTNEVGSTLCKKPPSPEGIDLLFKIAN